MISDEYSQVLVRESASRLAAPGSPQLCINLEKLAFAGGLWQLCR